MKMIQLPEEIVQAMLTKIAERPYIEVHGFITNIQQEIGKHNPPVQNGQ
jgi:hypothetical protein